MEVPEFVGDRGWLDKEFIRRFAKTFAHSRHVDYGIDENVGHVDAARSEIARDRFRQNALGGLGRRKAGEVRLAAKRGGVAGDENRALARLDHRRRHFARQIQETHDVHSKIMFELLRVDFEKGSPASSHRIVDEDIRDAVQFADVGNRVRDLALAGNVADHRVGVWQLSLKRTNAIRRTGQSDDAKSAGRETPDNRGPGAGSDTCDNGYRFTG